LATLVVVIAVEVPGSISAGSAGVALVTVLNCNQTLANLITYWTMMETSLGAVGRVRRFKQDTPMEEGLNRVPSAQWPQYGKVEIKNITCSWQDEANSVLRDVSLIVDPGQHVGICGRTGSGKSSLLLALFQMLPLHSGTVYIDGFDISAFEPDVLRSSLAAVPQDPFMFSDDSLRTNLCLGRPIEDDALRKGLESVGLWTYVASKNGLDALASSIGFSHGQKQLFCFARALISGSKIVVLDEATASCDAETNAQIQQVIQTVLRDRTVIAVEHRLENLLGCDKVAVLDNGRLVECGSPGTLLNTPGSAFKQLWEDSNRNAR
jgi:ATP-binding cassette subfamily C (CFTR/MRP) protein 1